MKVLFRIMRSRKTSRSILHAIKRMNPEHQARNDPPANIKWHNYLLGKDFRKLSHVNVYGNIFAIVERLLVKSRSRSMKSN